MTSFLERNCSIFVAQLLLGGGHLLLLLLELRDLGVERLQLGLGDVLALERHPRQIFVAGGERLPRLRVELDDLLLAASRS